MDFHALIALVGIFFTIVITVIGGTWTLMRKLSNVELNSTTHIGTVREKLGEVKGSIDVIAVKLLAHTEQDNSNFAELKTQIRGRRSNARR